MAYTCNHSTVGERGGESEPGLGYTVSLRLSWINSEKLPLVKHQNPLTPENRRNWENNFLQSSIAKETQGKGKGLAHSHSAYHFGARSLVQDSF